MPVLGARFRPAVGALAAFGLLALGAPVAAAQTPSQSPSLTSTARGPEGIVLEGTPVSGGSITESTRLAGPGDYTETLRGSNASLNYQVTRTQEGSTLRIAVLAATGPDGGEIAVKAHPNTSGKSCPSSSDWLGSQSGLLSTEIVLRPEDDCGGLEAYRIEVFGNAPERGLPFVLRVTQEPPVTSPGKSGTALNAITGPPDEGTDRGSVTGGRRLSDAPKLTTGHWTSEVVPGETRLYRVPLQYGQQVAVGVRYSTLSEDQQTALGTAYLTGSIKLLDPMLGTVAAPEGAVLSGTVGEATLFTATGSVNRGIQQVLSDGSTQLAGSYYLVVTAEPISSGSSVTLPFAIDVDIKGEPNSGPTYADNVEWRASSQVTAVAGGDPTDPAQGASTSTSSLNLLSIGSGAAGLLCIMSGVTLLLRYRKRRKNAFA